MAACRSFPATASGSPPSHDSLTTMDVDRAFAGRDGHGGDLADGNDERGSLAQADTEREEGPRRQGRSATAVPADSRCHHATGLGIRTVPSPAKPRLPRA